ncbi:MAG: hypothetical protein IM585_04275 [Pseudanabaena sp. M135S2SP2A07QC]|jgi:hypothetical protein|uniref:hypothetical protein n=1 Tax=Microcystis sp. M074S1 TaxID=2771126 RepID=UPI0025908ADB|nr:hypothetical protein [Microcystis sp. M074S1]MCA6501704.1 hypothetical protein [Pseudanabaena sp. M090S1SP2A07QC]MCA6527179.1 hypothetical protein [Pseudanabaena sp. M179S2SP2A07QC]MCA6528847.1 hypothetical protein [Pseudanabaena sp. M125S2SP2A07QC]MCA6533404.1 hypothetical protein [Pseudanabaena sp. M176S2SP2A07QC]MCA6539256.1 hypothetical protein [Pseudanabaena sp. M037S2SP2A07QC]MCA6548153.1 hypothetical protein [Pseudanabaena sp. M152S2SP2A07QC]MCA6551242.1 hypothetical protein [Pseud
MKKSFIYRTLQVASAITVFSMISMWAASNHIDIISDALTQIDSLLVILVIAVGLPYFCFKVLGKLYTPPKSRNPDKSSQSVASPLNQDEFNGDIEEEIEVMQYRGNRYRPEDLAVKSDQKNIDKAQPVIKYRGANVASIADESSQDFRDPLSAARESQKSAKPKERIKYRGSYVD